MNKSVILGVFCLCLNCLLPTQTRAGEDQGKVVVSGVVPDEAAKAAILGKLRDLYGAGQVIDRVEVGGVVPPNKWAENMTKILGPDLKQVHGGQIQITGTRISVKGRVANEALRQQVASNLATSLNPTYSIDNGLQVAEAEAQNILDKTLSNRVIEFESSSATLTPAGRVILDEMYEAIKKVGASKVRVIGHTDSSGSREANVTLSLARATTVRAYLIEKGIPAESLTAHGFGPDKPVSSNETVAGRAKNRRIEFRLTGE